MILRTIHVGVGGRGQWTVDIFGSDPKYRPVAIVDTNPTVAKIAQYRFEQAGHKSVPIFSGLTGALSQIEADALVIATPTRTHAEFARMGFVVGMHVLVEKGMTTDLGEAKALVEESKNAWSKFCVAQNYRYTACEQTISYILSRPEHPHHPGKVGVVEYTHHRYRPDSKELDYPYAMVWDMSCHHMDSLIQWLASRGKTITARSYAAPWTKYVHESNISAFIEFESGVVCNYSLTHDSSLSEWRVIFQGDKGALVMMDHSRLTFYPKPADDAAEVAPQGVECDIMDCPSPEQSIADEFFRYIVEDVEPGISGRRNLRTMAMCEALVRSAKGKKPVEMGELK